MADMPPPDQCDVLDQQKLIEFRAKSEHWQQLLHGDEEHSISAQLANMMWQDAAWRTANEARRFATEDGPTAAISPMLGSLLDGGYVSGQVLAIGRLLEVSDPNHPKKGVVSLRRLVDDLHQNRELFTREIFVAHAGLPYDWEKVRASQRYPDKAGTWLPMSGPDAWMEAMMMHSLFDALSASVDQPRARNDRLPVQLFDRLRVWLDDPVFRDVLQLRHKLIAHAADAFSRSRAPDLRRGLKLDEFGRAHRQLLGLTEAISSTLLRRSSIGSAVPVVQPEQFDYLTLGFIAPGRLKDLNDFWWRHSRECDDEMRAAYRELLPEAVDVKYQ